MIRKSDFWEMFVAVVCLFAFCTLSSAQNLTVASYNIRYENDGDYNRGNGWDARYPWICSFIRFEDPDIFGSQEVLKDQLSDMQSLLPSYSVVGVGRDDGVDEGEFEPIFFKKDRFRLLDKGWFWLAEDPTKPALGWDAACIRICTYVYLKDRVYSKTFPRNAPSFLYFYEEGTAAAIYDMRRLQYRRCGELRERLSSRPTVANPVFV